MAKTTRKRRSFTPGQRRKILAAAHATTVAAAAKKFSVHEVTIYGWRRGAGGGRTEKASNSLNGDIARAVRVEVRARVRELLPQVVREEVERALSGLQSEER